MRPFTLLSTSVFALSLLGAVTTGARADWDGDGIRLSPLVESQHAQKLVSDGLNGWFVSWSDYTTYDVFLQHLDGLGNIESGWPAEGLPVCVAPGNQATERVMLADGQGGVFMVWPDSRDGGYDPYLQHITSDGAIALGWPANGLRICAAPGDELDLRMVLDGVGGIVVIWTDSRDEATAPDVYAQRILINGSLDPSWPSNGRLIGHQNGYQSAGGVVATGSGGTVAIWGELLNGFFTYALGLNPDGSPSPGWNPSGQVIATPGRVIDVVADGAGGAFVALVDGRTAPPHAPESFYVDVYAQHMMVNGALAPGWTLDGIPIAVADLWQHPSLVVSDRAGGAYLAWSDARNYNGSATDIYAQRITAAGSLPNGWVVNGVRASAFPYFEEEAAVAVDASGGLVIAYTNIDDSRVYVQRLTVAGGLAVPTEPSGRTLTLGPTFRQERAQLSRDAIGNIVAVWADARFDQNDFDIYAKRVVASGATAVSATLVKAEAEPGTARLEWRLSQGVRLTGVFRSMDAQVWEQIGSPALIGADRVIFEDHSVQAGARYAYRLAYLDGGVQGNTAEVWVDVPAAYRFALSGAHPNPVVGEVNVHFSLSSSTRADLELFDLAGRSVAAASLTNPTPGPQHLRLADGRRLDPGVYWVRLRQGGDVAKSRVVVVR